MVNARNVGRSVVGALVVVGVLVVGVVVFGGVANAATVRRVPWRYATIQQAIDAADPGDEISVAAGRHCGAVIDKKVTLEGHDRATIVGCPDGPTLFGGLRAGFVLPGVAGDNPASGTRIEGFRFDGRDVNAADLTPLAFGVFARFADDVQITDNRFVGTVQAITNTAGDRWVIAHNVIRDLALFDCTAGLCAGGDGVVIQAATGDIATPAGPADAVNRPEGNVVYANVIEGTIPDGFDAFSMVGILLFAADQTLVRENRIALPDNPSADASGEGVLVTNNCCGDPNDVLPGSRSTVILFNDGRASELVVAVEGTGGENTQGLVLWGNRGAQLIEGTLTADDRPHRRHHYHHWFAKHHRRHFC